MHAAAGQAYTLRATADATQSGWARSGTWWVSAATARDGRGRTPADAVAGTDRGFGQAAPHPGHDRAHGRAERRLPRPASTCADAKLPFCSSRRRAAISRSTAPAWISATGGAEVRPCRVVSTRWTWRPSRVRSAAWSSPWVRPVLRRRRLPPPLPPDPGDPVRRANAGAGGSACCCPPGRRRMHRPGWWCAPSPCRWWRGPLLATVAAGSSLAVPVAIAPGGTLSVTELGVGPIAAGQTDNSQPGARDHRHPGVGPCADDRIVVAPQRAAARHRSPRRRRRARWPK